MVNKYKFKIKMCTFNQKKIWPIFGLFWPIFGLFFWPILAYFWPTTVGQK